MLFSDEKKRFKKLVPDRGRCLVIVGVCGGGGGGSFVDRCSL